MQDVLERSIISMDKTEARKAFLDYRRAVRERHSNEDAEIMRGYRALSRGMQLIRLSEAIKAGGAFDNGLPRLAVAQANTNWVWVARDGSGSVSFLPMAESWRMAHNRRKGVFRFGPGTLPTCAQLGHDMTKSMWDHPHRTWNQGQVRAMVPNVPPALRPAHALSGYATLFEVDKWEADPRPPGDPALLKHIGGDLYAVVAIWDLTPLEQAVLAGRTG